MYKVFINEKVICFTNNEENCIASKHYFVLRFFASEYIPILITLLESKDKINVAIVVEQYEEAFNVFQSYFTIIKAAGGIVSDANNKKLFIYRLDKWDLPKGKIEKGEGIKAAAVREIEEECGITDLSIIKQLQNTYHIYTYKKRLILKQTYWFELISSFNGKLVPQLAEGITKVMWLTAAQIKDKVMPNTYTSIKELLK